MKSLQLTADTVGTVARGHPWVYRNGVVGSAKVGEVVKLVDNRGKSVAFGLFDEGIIAVRVLGREPVDIPALIRVRIADAISKRAMIGGETDTYRLCNGEGDGLPGLILDRYGDVVVVRFYAKAWESWIGAIVEAIPSEFTTVYRRFGVGRVDDREGGESLRGSDPPDVVIVREHGMRLLARVKVGQKTGLFLDQREHRRLVRAWAAGRSVANLFSYNGGFSVAAALGGATRVVSVDQSAGAIEDAKENFRLNDLDPDAHGFEVGDVFAWKGKPVDFVICDPPSLTRDKSSDDPARGAYRSLHRHIAPMVGSLLATSSCTARLGADRWEECVRDGIGGGWSFLHRSGESLDHPVAIGHPEGRYLKFALLGRRA